MKYKIVGFHPMDAYHPSLHLIGTTITSNSLKSTKDMHPFVHGDAVNEKREKFYFRAVKVELVKSPWFPADVNPVHVGVYERDYGALLSPLVNKPEYQYWDGTKWYYGSRDVDEAYQLSAQKHVVHIPRSWRGIEK
jgi:hypothetical protein